MTDQKVCKVDNQEAVDPDTIQSTLDCALARLGDVQGAESRILEFLSGPRPCENGKAENPISCMKEQAAYIRDKSGEIASNLFQICSILGVKGGN